jgi:ketosteroid isomerase-like protein
MIENIDDAGVIAEVRACFEAYNRALDAGDVDALNGFFWASPSTVRFGPTENLFGYAEISAFRSGTWKPEGTRALERLAITALGSDVAVTNALFRGRSGALSRQSQTWARLQDGWRIVAAHVSPL